MMQIPQDVDEADVTFIAAALRAYGRESRAGRRNSTPVHLTQTSFQARALTKADPFPTELLMTAADAPDCGEWSLYTRGTAQAVA